MNQAIIQGAVVRTFAAQGANPHVRVVMDVYYRPKGADKNWREVFTVLFWGNDGQEFLDKAQLGSLVEITGSMRQSSYLDKKDGLKKHVFQIHATSFRVIGDQANIAGKDRPEPNDEVPF